MQTENKSTVFGKELTLGTLLEVLRRNVVWILLISIVCGALAGVYTALFVRTEYQGKSCYWVNNISENADYIQSTMVTASSQLAENYTEVVTQKITFEAAIDKYELDKVLGLSRKETVDYLGRVIKTEHETDSVLFTVIVTDTDTERAFLISKAIQDVFPTIIRDEINKKINQDENKPDSGVTEEQANINPIILTDYVSVEDDIVVINPPVVRNVVIIFFVIFLIVYAIFLLFNLMDTLIYDENSLKDNFELPILGTIPTWNTKSSKKGKRSVWKRLLGKPNIATANGKIVRDYEERLISSHAPFAVAEAFKLLRTNVSYSKTTSGTPVYVISSTVAGAGKSIISSNLALSFAALGKRTLIIESDMRCPTFSQIFSFDPDRSGLSELLTGIEHELDRVVVHNFVENLDILPAGHLPPNPAELLAQGVMGSYLAAWRECYDIILIDAPPYGEVSDAGVLASVVDGYVLVARSEYSDVAAVRRTVNSLKTLSAPILGFILNDVDPKSGKGYGKSYGYGYGYGYGNYYASESHSKTESES